MPCKKFAVVMKYISPSVVLLVLYFMDQSGRCDGVTPGSSCRTPNNEPAFCIPLRSCRSLIYALRSKDTSLHPFLQQSKCFHDHSSVYVCCGSKDNFTDSSTVYPPVPTTPGKLPTRRLCGRQHTDDRVYLENDTAIDEFPWMAIIKYYHDYDDGVEDSMCIGSLINRRYVLTNAECVAYNAFGLQYKYKISLGEYHRFNSTDCESSLGFPECAESIENIDVEEVILHPNYMGYPKTTNNIALIRLIRNVPFSDYIRPVCLPDADTKPLKIGDQFLTSGWGAVDVANLKNNTWDKLGERYSVLKKRSKNKIVESSHCLEKEGLITFFSNIEHEFCTRNDSNCIGDSGGPAMVKENYQWVQHAVYVTANACLNKDNAGVYEKLYKHMNWIRSTIKS